METRDLIDELDQDLVRLLARRAQLAKRVWIDQGDPREVDSRPSPRTQSARVRMQWAREQNLEPESIADIFSAVIRFCRSVQK